MLQSLLPLPASFFKVLPLSQKFNRFHIPALCFMKNASASDSSKSQMLPSLLPLPASFFNVLPLPQKSNRFRFQFPLPHPWIKLMTFCLLFSILIQKSIKPY